MSFFKMLHSFIRRTNEIVKINYVHHIVGACFILGPGGTDIFLIVIQAVNQIFALSINMYVFW
jgi:hypothetical protein